MATFQRVKTFMALINERKGFDQVLRKVKLVSAEPGKLVAELTVEQELENGGGTLHGGFTATLIDTLTTLTLLSRENGRPGVSINLNVTYLNAAKSGDLVTITAEALKVGKTMAFTTAELKLQDGRVVARGDHTKHLGVHKPAEPNL